MNRQLAIRTLAAIAILSALMLVHSVYQINKSPIAIISPVSMENGIWESNTFRTHYNKLYEIGLQVTPRGNRNELMCMLGVSGPGNPERYKCEGETPVVSLKWVVLEDSRLVAEGSTRPGQEGFYGSQIGRLVGRVSLPPRHSYRIKVTSFENASVLNEFNPQIEIRVHPNDAIENTITNSIYIIFFGLLGAIATVASIMILRGKWRE